MRRRYSMENSPKSHTAWTVFLPGSTRRLRWQGISLAVLRDDLPECLKVTAQTADGEIMAMRHKEYPVVGLQFHPESIYTEHGKRMIENFLSGVI